MYILFNSLKIAKHNNPFLMVHTVQSWNQINNSLTIKKMNYFFIFLLEVGFSFSPTMAFFFFFYHEGAYGKISWVGGGGGGYIKGCSKSLAFWGGGKNYQN